MTLSRRSLLKALGGGMLVLVGCRDRAAAGLRQQRNGGGQVPQDVSAWIHIAPDSKITVFTGKVEVGQDIRTSLAQAVADELRTPMESVEMIMGDTDRCPFDQGTFGSRTTPAMAPQLKRAAVTARETLLDMAAEKLKVDRASLTCRDGKIMSGSSSLTYGEVANGQPISRAIVAAAGLTGPADWKVQGQSPQKVAGRAIVTGDHEYTTDLKLPGMLYAKVLRPPTLGAELSSVSFSNNDATAGTQLVKDGSFAAVVGPSLRKAEEATFEAKVEWKEQPGSISDKTLFEALRGDRTGAAPAGNFRATYSANYIAHAPLEPRAAVADWKDGKVTVWTGTQRPFGVRGEVARALDLPETQVRVIVPDTGSGYGGKHSGDAAVEAARISRALQKPVKLVWTREEEFWFAYFRPAGVIDVTALLGDDKLLLNWYFTNYASGGAGLQTPYAVDSPQEQFRQVQTPLRTGSYRALASTFNHFARESAMDELALQAGADPVEFRIKHLKNERLRAVLERCADEFNWKQEERAKPFGRGIACGTEKGGYVATAVELHVEGTAVILDRVLTVFECGAVINPDGCSNQVEGSVLQGIGGALSEKICFENGKILTDKFSQYTVPRFKDMPKDHKVILLDRKDLPAAGAGEAAIVAIAPAIGNAIFRATGKRLRSLPMRLEQV